MFWGAKMAAPVVMGETGRFNILRLRYRARWDAYQRISRANAALRQTGQQPSAEELAAEQEAEEALAKARDDLLAAIRRLGH